MAPQCLSLPRYVKLGHYIQTSMMKNKTKQNLLIIYSTVE